MYLIGYKCVCVCVCVCMCCTVRVCVWYTTMKKNARAREQTVETRL
jgi:hypothetical protein